MKMIHILNHLYISFYDIHDIYNENLSLYCCGASEAKWIMHGSLVHQSVCQTLLLLVLRIFFEYLVQYLFTLCMLQKR